MDPPATASPSLSAALAAWERGVSLPPRKHFRALGFGRFEFLGWGTEPPPVPFEPDAGVAGGW